jgi:hypothetical protein
MKLFKVGRMASFFLTIIPYIVIIGIVIAVVHTNSTGMLAPLNGMILAGDVEFNAEGTSTTTLWEWQSGIPLPTTTSGGNSTDFLSATGGGGSKPAGTTRMSNSSSSV